MWLVYGAAPVGLALAALRTLQAIFRGSPEPEHHYEDKS
jgi:TRAP-type C4-dicarboxylate transport system permease small subunit